MYPQNCILQHVYPINLIPLNIKETTICRLPLVFTLISLIVLTKVDLLFGRVAFLPVLFLCLQTASKMHKYCVLAVQGFFRSISLSQNKSLQDTLR